MQIGAKPTPTTFSDMFKKETNPGGTFANVPGEKHLRLSPGGNLGDLHTHRTDKRSGIHFLDRAEKHKQAAVAIKKAIDAEVGTGMGDRVFKRLGLGNKVKVSDLATINAEVSKLKPSTVLTRALDGSDPNFTADFRTFLKKNVAEENLDFLLAVNEYEANPTPEKAKEIVANFVDGKQRINPGSTSNQADALFSAAKTLLTDQSKASMAFEGLKEAIMEQLEFGLAVDFVKQRAVGK